MTEKQRRSVRVLATAAVLVMLVSVVCILAGADHDCAGEECSVCCALGVCEKTLLCAGCAVASAAAVLPCVAVLCVPPSGRGSVRGAFSLISLKVKLSE